MTPERVIEIRDSLLPSQGEAFDCLAFARAIIAETREECARVCEEQAGTVSMFATSADARAHNKAIKGCAAAIRAKG